MKADKNIPVHLLPGGQFRASAVSTAFGEHSPNHRIDFYAVVWFTEDGGQHFIDFEPYQITKDTVYFIGKGQVHSIPSERLPQARTMVFFEECFHRIEEPFLRQLFLPFDNRGIRISNELLIPVTNLFDLIVMESNGAADLNLLIKLVSAWLTLLHRLASESVFIDAGTDPRITKILQLIQTDFREQRSAEYYAGQVGLTPKRVNEILRDKAGLTINQLVSQLLLVEAKRQLFHGELSVKEIAYQLGFSDQSYFARFFKKHTGISPEHFRNREATAPILNVKIG